MGHVAWIFVLHIVYLFIKPLKPAESTIERVDSRIIVISLMFMSFAITISSTKGDLSCVRILIRKPASPLECLVDHRCAGITRQHERKETDVGQRYLRGLITKLDAWFAIYGGKFNYNVQGFAFLFESR